MFAVCVTQFDGLQIQEVREKCSPRISTVTEGSSGPGEKLFSGPPGRADRLTIFTLPRKE